MIFSLKDNIRLLRHTYRQLAFLWLIYIVLAAACGFFVMKVVRNYLDKSAQNVLSNLQSKVASDLLESETALRSVSFNIRRMMLDGSNESEMREYIREFNEYVLADNRRVTGVMNIYGVFNAYGGVFVDGYSVGRRSRLDEPWYKEAINARGNIAISPPHFDEGIGEWKISFSRQIQNEQGRTVAVIGLDMHLGALGKYFTGTSLAEGGYCIMVDENLNIITTAAREAIGKPLSALMSPDIYRIMAVLNKGENLTGFVTVNNRRGGEKIIVHSRRIDNGWHVGVLTPINAFNKDVYEMGFTLIIFGTLLQLTLSLIVLRIAAAKLSSEEKSKQKSNFLANMSHEIRTPMNAIIGFAELALREDIPPAAYEHVFMIKQAGTNLLSIINDILDISKIESGKMEIVEDDYQFISLVSDIVSIIKMKATYSRLRFVVNIDSNIPNALIGDEMKVRQVLLNILSNAVKYTDKGFVSLTITGRAGGENTIFLTIVVADSGKGIKRDDLDKLFKDFVQVDKLKNKGIEGTGLGLVITNNILKAMDGSIEVKSEYGHGSVFTVQLPQRVRNLERHAFVEDRENKNVLLYERRDIHSNSIIYALENLGVKCSHASSEDEFEEMAKSNEYQFFFIAPIHCDFAKDIIAEHGLNAKLILLTEFGDTIPDLNTTILSMPVYSVSIAAVLNGGSKHPGYGTPKDGFAKFVAPDAKALVVDDTSTNLRVAEGLLSPYKMQITLCKSGYEAIEAARSDQYDIVFMDQMMPGMDGLEATRQIRSLGGEHYLNLPIIALTANAVAGAKEMFLSEGFNDFISKPIDIAKLNAVMDKWIPAEKRKSPAETDAEFDVANAEDDAVEIIIDGVDVEKGLMLSGGNRANYRRTITMFYEDGFGKIEEIKRCLETQDLHLYTTHVHGLKSASASIGANQLAETALALENAGKKKNAAYISEHTPKFLLDLETILRNIGRVLDALKKSENNSNATAETLIPELIKLKNALDSFDSEAIDKATNTLQVFENTEEFGEEVKAILQYVLIGEYDEVFGAIDDLLGRLRLV